MREQRVVGHDGTVVVSGGVTGAPLDPMAYASCSYSTCACGQVVLLSDNFCRFCGKVLRATCRGCGQPLPSVESR